MPANEQYKSARRLSKTIYKSRGIKFLKSKLRIAINAQIISGSGTSSLETVLRVLASLSQLDGDEEYVFIGYQGEADWLKPFLNERQTLICPPLPSPSRAETLKRAFGPLRPFIRGIKHSIAGLPQANFSVPVSDGFYENLNCDVIHFPYPDFVLCRNVPTIYNPHDLQHLHYPEFFAPDVIRRRAVMYPTACRAARTVVAASQFVKQDIVRRFGTAEDKIQVIPWSPPETVLNEFTEKDADALLEKYALPPRPFVLYPAMTWEHKNHLRLLEAVAGLREREGLIINVVCTGYKHDFFARIDERRRELGLENQVRFPGVVTIEELSLLYRLAQFVVIPTLFEAASGPLFEAWQHNVAAACSRVTSLPEQAAGAALLFNPFSVEDIADALKIMASDENLRSELRSNGFRRLRDFDLQRTLKAYRAVYRQAAGVVLNEEDRYLLNWDWMCDSSAALSKEPPNQS